MSVQFSRTVVSDSATPWIAARQASLSITNFRSLLKLMPIESVMPSSHLILYRPLLLLPPIPPRIRIFSNESTLYMRWPKYWSFSFSISPSNEHPGLISFLHKKLVLVTTNRHLKLMILVLFYVCTNLGSLKFYIDMYLNYLRPQISKIQNAESCLFYPEFPLGCTVGGLWLNSLYKEILSNTLWSFCLYFNNWQ